MLVDISATMGLAGMLICLEGLTTLWNKGCCNVQNPFRGTWVVGTPGSRKSFLVTFLRIWISILSTSLMWSAPRVTDVSTGQWRRRILFTCFIHHSVEGWV